MPLECERSSASPSTTAPALSSAALIASEAQHSQQSVSPSNHLNEELNHLQVTTAATTTTTSIMDGEMSTSQTSTTSNGSSCNGGSGRKTSITSPDPTAYVAKARVTRPTPPPPPYNPMQFVQIKPCNLYQTAQEQLKKAEEVKKIKEIRKEEPEDWQNNLDNWKSSRRKRVEHIIDRVVEVKKLELEEHDRTRRKSKTFSEMIEDRNDRVGRPALKKLASLAVYTEDESNDLSDLGIGTSSASGKSSLSEDYDNNSVMSDNAAELDKAITNSQNNHHQHHNNNNNSKANNHHHPHQSTDNTHSTTREYISSPGYETSSSTAPASTPDPCEYTYEGAIQDYKQRVSRAVAATTTVGKNSTNLPQQPSKESTPERNSAYPPRRGSKIEDRLIGFEVQSPSEECIVGEKAKVDLPKIDISKRKEIFEVQASAESKVSSSASGVPRVTLRDRFKPSVESAAENIEVAGAAKKEVRRLSGDITSIKERLQSLEQQKQNLVNGATAGGAQTKVTANKLVDVPVPPLKERLSSLQNAVTKEEVRKPPVALVDARQLEIMKSEEEKVKQQQQIQKQTPAEVIPEVKEEDTGVKSSSQINEISTTTTTTTLTSIETINSNKNETTITTTTTSEVDRDDSGIHTADDIEVPDDHLKKEQELKLNAAIEALAMEEQQFAKAASAVNQIEAEFEELSLGGSVTLPPLANSSVNGSASSATTNTTTSSSSITNDHMEYSVSSTNPCTSPKPDSSSLSSSCNSPCSLDNSAVKVAGGSPCNLRRKPTNEMVHAKNLLKIFKDTFKSDIELDEDEPGRHEPETKDIPGKNLKQEAIKSQVFENQKMTASQVVNEATEVNSKLPPSGPGATRKNIQTPLSPVLSRGAIISPPSSPGGQDFKNNSHGTPSSPSSAAGRVFKTPLSPILSRGPLKGPQGNKTPLSPILSRGPLEASQGNKTPLSPILSRVAREGQREATKSPILSSRPQTPMSPLTVRSTTKFHDPDTPPQSPSASRKHDSQFSINGRVEIFNSKQMTHDNIVPAAKLNAPHSPQITTKITYLPHISVSEKNAASNIELPQGNGVMKSPITTENSAQSDGVTKSAVTTETTPHVVPSTSDDAYEDEVVALSMAEKKSLFEMKSKGQMVNEPQHNKAGHPGVAGGGGGGAGGGVKALAKSIEGNATATIPLPKPLTPASKPMKQQPAATAAGTAHEQQPASEVVVCAPPITIVNPDELPKPNTVKTLSSCFQPGQSSSCGGGNAKPQALGNSRTTTVIYGEQKSISPSSPLLGKDDPLASMISSSTSTSSNTTVCTVIEANKTLSVMSNSSSDSMAVTPTMVETSAQIHGEREQRKSAEQQNLEKGISQEKIFSTGAKEAGSKDGIFSFESKDKKKDNKVEISSLGTKEIGDKISSPESKATKKDEQQIMTPPGTEENKKEAKSGFFSAGIKEVKDKIPFLGSKETKKDDKENASSSGDKDIKKDDKKQAGITPQEAEENLALRALLKDFLETEIQFSETCEIKPLGNRAMSKPLDIDEVDKATTFSSQKAKEIPKIEQKTKESHTPIPDEVNKSNTFANEKVQHKEITKLGTKGSHTPIPDENGKTSANQTNLAKSQESHTPVPEKSIGSPTQNGKLKNTQKIENQSHESSTPIPETPEMLALKESMKDFLNTEIEYSEVVESKSPHMPFESPLQPLKVVLKDTGEVRGKVELSSPSLEQNKKSPLTIDLSHEDHQNLISSGPSTPLSPTSQLFRTTKPLVVSTLYDKYLPEGPKSPSHTNFSEGPKSPTPEYLVEEPKTPTYPLSNKSSNSAQAPPSPLSNMRPTSPTTKKPSEKGPTIAPSIMIPAELPNLVECPPNDSTLYKLASSAPHSPVSPRSASSFDMDSALCSNLLTSMAATADFVNFERQHTVEEDLCQKVDVEALPIDKKTPCTGFKDITNKDLKKSQNVGPKIIHKMHDAPAAPTAVDETCLKLDVHSLPYDKRQPITAYQAVSPTELKKRDNLFSSPPHSPIMEARAAHSKALIETCEKIIAEEKQVNQQLKSSLPNTPSSPKATPVLQRKSKIPKPLNTCCTATESMNEADLKNKTPANKDEAVIARMHVVETQIKVTTSTPPASPKTPASTTTSTTTTTPSPKPQASPTVGKKAKNIFDFIKKNFGVGGANKDSEEEPIAKEEKVTPKSTETYKPLESPEEPVAPPSQPLVLTESELQALDTVKYNEIHNIENSKFYLPSDDVAPPPLPKTPAPVNIEITRKIITDEIMEDGKTEVEFSSEIDALLDVELNKLNHEIEELDKVAASGVKQ
ncbi:uncharacterized protein CG43427 isoform X1 [Musca domestica]|uniref:Uncharacterized protein CG43427 isoform X1 n=1 Tax=Musca domestica TaxID=7370 RepID=A0A9J7I7S2_MUSDO|nr:uncharacterized protein CG43427 isoform X1 [Musca domestica]XP_019890492.2 uncharacterized protein CG43427 isoform X1 [Musca domestica]XP_058986518.1 uncharacterized protein CG43427 isoform X1 [Musca domestica]XP_058986519.1 uncharacterized protein CG43427 isoform X1 [Musca domestica]